MQTNELVNELGTNFIEYAASVNSDRSIPDARSGLKPVARRILWGSLDGGYTSNKEHAKCARIVGDVMGKWHPHGDSSIYGALVRLSQPWVMRYPLIDFHGNMGNIDGDGPAAYRYTNARLTKIAEEGLLAGIKKDAVDFVPNYDENDNEPVTLPSLFPNLLCNPNSGIGVAIACNWAPHNLREVATAICNYIDGKEPSLPGPDFPTGGVIINKDDIPAIMKTGRGSVKIRGKYKIEKQNIIFYEVPYEVKVEKLLEEIGELCDKKELENIVEIRNESGKKGLRIVIECDKTVNPESVLPKLFAKTDLQTSFSYNQVALVNKTPVELNLKQCIDIYVKHNIDCLIRMNKFDLAKANNKLEIVNGLLKALENIDAIIALIKKSKSVADAQQSLIATYKFTEPQAKAIVDMKLGKLSGLEKIELNNEQKDLEEKIQKYIAFIENEEIQKSELKSLLTAFAAKYGDDRRTELTQIEISKTEKEIEMITPEDCVVVISQTGLIKRVPKKSFKVQKRGGKGIKTEDEAILDTISTNTVDTLMVFSNAGKMYRVLVNDLPVGTNATKGLPISNFIKIEPNEKVIATTSLYRKTNAEYVVFITKCGLVKKTCLSEYTSIKKGTGIAAIKLKDGDSIANVTFIKDEPLVLISEMGNCIRFETTQIAPIGRNTSGVKSIKLDEGDSVLIGLPIHNYNDCLAIFTNIGNGKKISINDLPLQARGGKGVRIAPKGCFVVGAAFICDEDDILLTNKTNSICVNAKDIPEMGRTANGNIMIKTGSITHITKL